MFESTFIGGLNVYTSGASRALLDFHKSFLDCSELVCSSPASLGLLKDQIDARVLAMQQMHTQARNHLKLKQRTTSRLFVKYIAQYMKDIYDQCGHEHGTSVYSSQLVEV
jgi:hypothetical protein